MPEETTAREERIAHRRQFTKGRRFRVMRAGASLWGWQGAAGGGLQGWSQELEPGDIITCDGESMTRGDGVSAVKWRGADGEGLAVDCLFRPVTGGMWGGQVPEPGFLEALD